MKVRHLVLIFCTTICTFAFVWVRLQIVRISYDINQLSAQEKQLREQVNTLSLKYNEERSPKRLAMLAEKKFGMKPMQPNQLIILDSRP